MSVGGGRGGAAGGRAGDAGSRDAGGATYLFCGGGSGGHINPALAIAERLAEIEPAAGVVFVCSQRAIDATILAEAGARYEPVPAAPLSLGPRGLARFGAGFARTVGAARTLIRRAGVRRVVATGGFVSAPVVVAARGCGVRVTLLSLDDPPGLANRWMAPLCDIVVSAVPVRGRRFAGHVTGVPVRRRALAPGGRQECRRRLGLDPERPTLLVTGASQGSRSVNALVAELLAARPSMFDRWQVLHLAGPHEGRDLEQAYTSAGVPAVVEPFIHVMGPVWGSADLCLSRAGASSVAEAWANGVPTLFLPYPYHRDQHQRRNAIPMVRAGGAVVETDLVEPARNAAVAGKTLAALMADAGRRDAMRRALAERPAPDAAGEVARLLAG